MDLALVVERDPCHLFGRCKNDVEVLDRQQLFLAAFQTFHPVTALALRAVSIPAGVVRDTDVIAGTAFFDMATERGGAPGFEKPHDAQVLARVFVLRTVSFAVLRKDISQPDCGPQHRRLLLRFPGSLFRLADKLVEGSRCAGHHMIRHLRVACGSKDTRVPQECLDHPCIRTVLQHVCRETVPQGMSRDAF